MLAKVAARSVATGARQMGNRSASSITAVKGREVIDSRGNPTMEVRDHFVDSFFFLFFATHSNYSHRMLYVA